MSKKWKRYSKMVQLVNMGFQKVEKEVKPGGHGPQKKMEEPILVKCTCDHRADVAGKMVMKEPNRDMTVVTQVDTGIQHFWGGAYFGFINTYAKDS